MRCIAKGDEITHIYQGHFGDTRKEERQRILKNMFHFDCFCAACTSNYPLGRNIPKTYEKCSKYIFKSVGAVPYIKDIQQSLEKCHLNLSFDAKFKKHWMDVVVPEINSSRVTKDQNSFDTLFRMLDQFHESLNEQLPELLENKNIDGVLNLYHQILRVANIFLKPPHMIFLNGRGVITDCLWVKYGNKAYGASISSESA